MTKTMTLTYFLKHSHDKQQQPTTTNNQ